MKVVQVMASLSLQKSVSFDSLRFLSIADMPSSMDICQLECFLGMINVMQAFVPHL